MPAPNLATLLSTKADEVTRPIALPEGTYFGIIKEHKFGESSKKKTPLVEYSVQLTHAHADVDLSEVENEKGFKPVGERVFRHSLYLSDNALFMLTDFIKSCGVATEGRTLNELIPSVVGQPVVMDIAANPTEDGKGQWNEVKRCVGTEAV